MISKQWSGLAREAFTDSDNFGVSFPQDLDVKAKVMYFILANEVKINIKLKT